MPKIQINKETELYRGRIFRLVQEELDIGAQKPVLRDVIRHPGAVVMIPQEADGKLLVVQQYRHALRKVIMEFPAGTLEPGEDPRDCARRELTEEVGRSAREWHDLGLLYPAPGICDEVQHCYLARQLSMFKTDGDEDEFIEVESLTIQEVEKAILEDRMRDAKSIAIFTRAKLRGML